MTDDWKDVVRRRSTGGIKGGLPVGADCIEFTEIENEPRETEVGSEPSYWYDGVYFPIKEDSIEAAPLDGLLETLSDGCPVCGEEAEGVVIRGEGDARMVPCYDDLTKDDLP